MFLNYLRFETQISTTLFIVSKKFKSLHPQNIVSALFYLKDKNICVHTVALKEGIAVKAVVNIVRMDMIKKQTHLDSDFYA